MAGRYRILECMFLVQDIKSRKKLKGDDKMKLKKRWMAAFLSFVLVFGFCVGDMQTVQAKAKKLTLNYTSVTMQKGAKLTLRVTAVSPTGASKKVTWKSSDKKVVSVSKKGVITAKKKGTATITAKAKRVEERN